ncbi:MAG: pilus assembly protein PilP [Polyangiaceae bacterium]|nr:pilus assembly protein PilP [Polyangiaceae bacterium]
MSLARRSQAIFLAATVASAGSVGLGCETRVVTSPYAGQSTVKKPSPAASASASSSALAEAPRFRDVDFVETEQSRDPFRSFSKAFSRESTAAVRAQREVLLERYSIDELKLVGIVTGGGTEPLAMFVDPQGTGWIVRRGQFIGKPDTVRAAGPGGATYERTWRVDRIRDGDVVLVCENASRSDDSHDTRVIPLRPEDSAAPIH